MTRILIVNGNPARQRESFSEALGNAYAEAAKEAGHEVRTLKIAALDFDPILHEGYHGHQPPEPHVKAAQDFISWAEHVVVVYPMWQFGVPALLKGFCERTLTPGFAYSVTGKNPLEAALLKGRSVRLIQTMGMPAIFYTAAFRAHGGKAFRSLFSFCGFAPVRTTFLGMIESGDGTRRKHLSRVRKLGAAAQ
jgi:putative NADPH-quinone reductase